MQRAKDAEVHAMIAIGGNAPANALSLKLAKEHPEKIYGCAGYDRDEATARRICGDSPLEPKNTEQGMPNSDGEDNSGVIDLLLLREQVANPLCKAVGETGLDYYHLTKGKESSQKRTQRAFFTAHAALAAQLDLPLVIHTRDAASDTIALIKEYNMRRIVVHCFSQNRTFAEELLSWSDDVYFSFSGILTYKQAIAVQEDESSAAVTPSLETVESGQYPLSRQLFFYTVGEPTGQVKEFIDWVLSPEGQEISEAVGYYPLSQS